MLSLCTYRKRSQEGKWFALAKDGSEVSVPDKTPHINLGVTLVKAGAEVKELYIDGDWGVTKTADIYDIMLVPTARRKLGLIARLRSGWGIGLKPLKKICESCGWDRPLKDFRKNNALNCIQCSEGEVPKVTWVKPEKGRADITIYEQSNVEAGK